jgi:hypothetical protein
MVADIGTIFKYGAVKVDAIIKGTVPVQIDRRGGGCWSCRSGRVDIRSSSTTNGRYAVPGILQTNGGGAGHGGAVAV